MQTKAEDYKKYLDPSVVSKLNSLELKARAVVEGFMVGYHKSPYHGFSVEFSEHRPYLQGDSIRNIDWKVYGRKEEFFVKRYEEETNLVCNVVIDISRSMNYQNKGKLSKLEYAKILAASLSYLMVKQQDAVGLTLFSDKIVNEIQPKASRIYLSRILSTLSEAQSANSTNTSKCLDVVSERIKKRGLVIIISDFFDDTDKVLNSIKRFRYKKNEVIVFQLLDPIERNFAFENDAIFVDMETGEELTTQSVQIQKEYQKTFTNYLHKLSSECLNNGIEYNLIDTSQDFDTALLSYFKKRIKLH